MKDTDALAEAAGSTERLVRQIEAALAALESGELARWRGRVARARSASRGPPRIVEVTRSQGRVARPHGAEPAAADLSGAARVAVEAASRRAGARGVAVSVSLDENPTVRISQGALAQVLFELLIHAVEATPKGGRVALRTSSQKGHVRIEVESPREASGLELFLARQLVLAHGGELAYAGSPRGTTFAVTLRHAHASVYTS